jgi:hypothetical protein
MGGRPSAVYNLGYLSVVRRLGYGQWTITVLERDFPRGLANISTYGTWLSETPMHSKQCSAAVGNSPLNLDESSDHGLGQRYDS